MLGFLWIAAPYLAVVNVAGFLVMRLDKLRAQRGGRRIPEQDLFAMAFIGGGVGIWAGMHAFRHKTLHRRFAWGIPAIVCLQIAAAVAAAATGWPFGRP